MTENKVASFYEGAIQKRQQYLEQFDKSLSNYYNNLKYRLQVFRISKKSTDQYIASDFNLFDFICPNENMLSDIISELIDVNGNHG